jgi:4-hydroxy-tetrahydrodipicolinate synthase
MMIATGAMTAIVTPMRDGSPDFAALEALVNEQIEAGIEGLVAVGTTGESATLAVPEHLEVIKQTLRFTDGRVPVIAGAGGNSTAEAVALSQASEAAGAQALLQVTPYYNKPTQEGLFRHFEAISAASALPIIVYNVPGRTSCDLLPETVARLAELPTIVAVKESTGDMRRASEILELCGSKIKVLSGDDFTSYSLMSLGGHGMISVVANILPAPVARMCKAARAGDWEAARKEHFAIMPLSKLLFVESNPIPVKAAMHLLGKMEKDIRLPLTPASEETCQLLRAQLQLEGLL